MGSYDELHRDVATSYLLAVRPGICTCELDLHDFTSPLRTSETEPSAIIPDSVGADIAQTSVLEPFANYGSKVKNCMKRSQPEKNFSVEIFVLPGDLTSFGVKCLVHDNHNLRWI